MTHTSRRDRGKIDRQQKAIQKRDEKQARKEQKRAEKPASPPSPSTDKE